MIYNGVESAPGGGPGASKILNYTCSSDTITVKIKFFGFIFNQGNDKDMHIISYDLIKEVRGRTYFAETDAKQNFLNCKELKICKAIPGSFLGFLRGMNFAPMAKAIEGPKKKPLASIPTENIQN